MTAQNCQDKCTAVHDMTSLPGRARQAVVARNIAVKEMDPRVKPAASVGKGGRGDLVFRRTLTRRAHDHVFGARGRGGSALRQNGSARAAFAHPCIGLR
jgi:hypothetical protein